MRYGFALFVFVSSSFALAQAPPPYQKKGLAEYRAKEFAACARTFSEAVRNEPEQTLAAPIGAARCHAAGDNAREARRYLELALARGYRNCKVLAEDAVLAAVRTDAHIQQCHTNEERFYSGLNAEIFVAFQNDQRDRADEALTPAAVLARDAERRRLVSLALSTRSLRTADDYYHAAMIMQHGDTAADIASARELARRAARLDPSNGNALWLYAAATDRALQMEGRPQIYGTQYSQADGKWTLEPFDPNAVTDAERARWRVPPLAEQRELIEKLNAPEPQGGS